MAVIRDDADLIHAIRHNPEYSDAVNYIHQNATPLSVAITSFHDEGENANSKREVIKALLDCKANPNEPLQSPPLMIAISQKVDAEIVGLLLAAGANPILRNKIIGDTPLGYVVTKTTESNDLKIINLLLKAGANPNSGHPEKTPLDKAVNAAIRSSNILDLEKIKILLENGGDVNLEYKERRYGLQPDIMKTSFSEALDNSVEVSNILINHLYSSKGRFSNSDKIDKISSHIFVALVKGDFDLASSVSDLYNDYNIAAKVNEYKIKYLFTFISSGYTKEIHNIISCSNDILDTTNKAGSTLLMEAINYGYTEIVEALLSSGANPNKCSDNKVSPLTLATWRGNLEIIKMLTDKEAIITEAIPPEALNQKELREKITQKISRRLDLNSTLNSDKIKEILKDGNFSNDHRKEIIEIIEKMEDKQRMSGITDPSIEIFIIQREINGVDDQKISKEIKNRFMEQLESYLKTSLSFENLKTSIADITCDEEAKNNCGPKTPKELVDELSSTIIKDFVHALLILDARYGCTCRAKAIIQNYGIDVTHKSDRFGSDPLMVANQFGKKEIVTILENAKNNPTPSPQPDSLPRLLNIGEEKKENDREH